MTNLNGNMRNITEQPGLPIATRYFAWDEANRLKAVNKANTLVQHHLYDANGERSHKGIGNLFYMGINGGPQGHDHYIGNYQLYPSGYLTVGEYDLVTKHYYTGTSRIASRLAGDVTDFHAANENGEYGVQTSGLEGRQENDINAAFDQFKLSHPAIWNVPGMAPPCNQGEEEDELCACVFQHQCGTGPIYFFHSDHLGSSTFLTDGSGQPYQFLHNLPFGDVRSHPDIYRPGTMEEQFALSPNAWWKTPYLFNGKELVSRTSLYYYGARYYDPGLSVWLSVDPLAEKYAAWTPYNYTMQNPINLVDPDGRGSKSMDWYPEYDEKSNRINLVAEPGDNLKTLKTWSNGAFSDKEITNLYKKLDNGKIDLSQTFIGGFIDGFNADNEGCNFNCFSAVESGMLGQDKDSGYGVSNQRQFKNFIDKNSLNTTPAIPEIVDALQPFKAILGYTIPNSGGELDHVSIFAGKDKSGTPWVLTRNGYRSGNDDGSLSKDNMIQFQKGTTFRGINGSIQPDRVYKRR